MVTATLTISKHRMVTNTGLIPHHSSTDQRMVTNILLMYNQRVAIII